jgi:phosphate transport system permease protein
MLNRVIIDKFYTSWKVFCLLVILILPFLLFIGLCYKSSFIIEKHSLAELLFSKTWSPWNNKFGFLPFIMSSLWVTFLAILFTAPLCVLTAIYLTQYSKNIFLKIFQPIVDILAGIPSVVYGVWGILIVVPFVSGYIAPVFNVQTSGYSVLSGSIVLAIMIIPYILNILIEIFKSVPDELMEASLSLGATKWESVKSILLRKTFSGIISSFVLGISRAFGETIAVLMVVGNMIHIPHSVFDAGYPLPALLANNYGEMLSIPMYDSALMFSALILFLIVLLFNFFARSLILKYETSGK